MKRTARRLSSLLSVDLKSGRPGRPKQESIPTVLLRKLYKPLALRRLPPNELGLSCYVRQFEIPITDYTRGDRE